MKPSVTRVALIALVWAALPAAAVAQTAGVDALLNQARYWQSKGRRDLAGQAYRRVLQVDPNNAAARQGLAATNAPARQPSAPAAAPKATAATRASTSPAPSPAPAPVRADRGGDARAAGFRALNAGDLNTAASRFNAALSANPRDADALGGLGLVRLRDGRFDDARDLLGRASKLGNPGRWSQALAAAEFYGDLGKAQMPMTMAALPMPRPWHPNSRSPVSVIARRRCNCSRRSIKRKAGSARPPICSVRPRRSATAAMPANCKPRRSMPGQCRQWRRATRLLRSNCSSARSHRTGRIPGSATITAAFSRSRGAAPRPARRSRRCRKARTRRRCSPPPCSVATPNSRCRPKRCSRVFPRRSARRICPISRSA